MKKIISAILYFAFFATNTASASDQWKYAFENAAASIVYSVSYRTERVISDALFRPAERRQELREVDHQIEIQRRWQEAYRQERHANSCVQHILVRENGEYVVKEQTHECSRPTTFAQTRQAYQQ